MMWSRNPPAGAHNDPVAAAALLDEKLVWHLSELRAMPAEERIATPSRQVPGDCPVLQERLERISYGYPKSPRQARLFRQEKPL